MLNFDNLDGFVIDLTNKQETEDLYCYVFDCDTPPCDMETMRYYLIDFYTSNYSYVFCKSPHVYFICEEDLYVKEID